MAAHVTQVRQVGDDVVREVREAAAGDGEAWNALVRRFGGLVWAVCRAHRLDRATAEDVAQVVWIRLVEQVGSIREPERVGSWLATTTRRECLRVMKRSSRETPSPDSFFERSSGEVFGAADLEVQASERDRRLWQALGRLSPARQRLMRLLMADPRPGYDEVAAALGIPIGSIGPTRQRCLERLRRTPELAGLASEDWL
jgi:RNA polymerase sigma factor (sigma-70 family)